MENLDVVVVVVPFVAQGHLNQLLHLSRLLSAYNLPVHIAGTTTHNRQAKLRIHGWNHNSNTNIHFHEFETPQFESPPPNPTSSTKFPSHLIHHSKHHLIYEPFAKLLANISNTARRVVVIHDFLMSTVVQDVVSYPNVEAYVFHCASAFTTFSYMWEEKGRPCLEDDDESYMQLSKLATIQDLVPREFFEFIYTHVGCEKFNAGNIHDTSKGFLVTQSNGQLVLLIQCP
ncbi:putative trans-zeatin O-beta-D-glucosyltransferase [Helianthus anomalus]